MKNYNNMKFDLIDVNVNLTPDIFINRGGITFTKRVLEDLGYPANVQYSLSAEHKVFTVRACKIKDSKAAPFSKSKSEQTQTLNTGNKNIVEPIKALLNNYDPQMRYRIQGHFNPEGRIMYFDLEEAIAEPFRARKSE